MRASAIERPATLPVAHSDHTHAAEGAPQSATGTLGHDHTGGSSSNPRTYNLENAMISRANGNQGGSNEWNTSTLIGVGAVIWLTSMAASLTMNYYIQKDAVHNGIRAAVRDGSLGNPQNRIAANQ